MPDAGKTNQDTRGNVSYGGIVLMILMTGLVVFTSALYVGAFTSDYEQVQQPSTTIEFDHVDQSSSGEALVIQHKQGTAINPPQLSIDVTGAACTGTGDPNGTYNGQEAFGLSDDNWFRAANSLRLDETNPEPLCPDGTLSFDDATVEVRWKNPRGNNKIIAEWDGPS